MIARLFTVICGLLILSVSGVVQGQDSLRMTSGENVLAQPVKEHSPARASLYSALLPGAGQVYNKKYWKVPIVYAGIGISLYFAFDNRQQYHYFRDQYRYLIDDDSTTVSDFPNVNPAGLRDLRDDYRRWMELSYISAGLFYILNIIDANVDAHLMEFNVSDDLSLRVEPQMLYAGAQRIPSAGFRLTLRPKR